MKTENFSLGWLFAECKADTPLPDADAAFIPVDLPHDWQIRHARDLYRDSTGFYKKRFICRLDGGRRLAVRFNGAYMDTTVFVNEHEAGQWKNGYTPFWFDITDLINEGENELLVRCNLKHPNSRWYSGAGLYRTVELWTMPVLHLIPDGLYAAAREADGARWTVKLRAEVGAAEDIDARGAAVEFRLIDNEGQRVAAITVPAGEWGKPSAPENWRTGCEKSICMCSAEISVEDPALWSPEQPNVYKIEAALQSSGGEDLDTLETPFGFRTVEMKSDSGLWINHKRVILHGVNMHHDLGCLGSAFETDAVERQLCILHDMGANAIRTGHTLPDRAVMDMADTKGFLIDSEIFDCWRQSKNPYDYARFFDEWQERDVAAWIRRDRNHPSLLLWSLGNEIYDMHAGQDGNATLKMLLAEVKEHDPFGNGIPTFGSNYLPWANTQKCADIIKCVGYNYGENLFEEHHKAHPDWAIYTSESASVVQSRGIYRFPLSQPVLADDDLQCSSLGNSRTSWGSGSVDAALLSDRKYPFIAGQFLWTGFDYIGEPTPYHTRTSYFGMIDTAGFEKDAYYICQSAWLDPERHPMVHLFPYWDYNEGEIIDVRACTNLDSVELFCNGESMGRRTVDLSEGYTVTWQVPYRPGVISVTAYDRDGVSRAADSRSSFGDSAALRITADKTEISGDGRALSFLTIDTVDANGIPVDNANNRVTVEVNGAGVLVGLDNGDSSDTCEYQTSCRDLFSGKLLAVVSGSGKEGAIDITVKSPGLKSASISLKALPFADSVRHRLSPLPAEGADDIYVRKLELSADRVRLTPAETAARVSAKRFPAAQGRHFGEDIEWRLTDTRGIPSTNATIQIDGDTATVTALGDGIIHVRAMVKNARSAPQVISQLTLTPVGFEELNKNPYEFVFGGRFDAKYGDVGNGNEHGVSTARTGRSWVMFNSLDFGPDGADEVELPIFALTSDAVSLRFWQGKPGASESVMIGERVYHKPMQWNTYQTETFRLDKRLTGITSFAIETDTKMHIKGFRFNAYSRAYDCINAGDCSSIYGDSYEISNHKVLNIGNNVSLVFDRMDFGDTGTSGVYITGRSNLPSNTIHLLFDKEDGTPPERRKLEFTSQPEWGEQKFTFNCVTGRRRVTFLFLPGTQFDFESFKFF